MSEPWEPDLEELEQARALDPQARYDLFAERVLDAGQVWLLADDDEIAILHDEDEDVVYMPMWPHPRLAELEREDDDWQRYEVRAMPLDELLGSLLPKLAADGVEVGVFPVWDRGVWSIEADDLRSELLAELDENG